MTKADLVTQVSRKTGLTKKEVLVVVNAIFDSLKDAFGRREKVELRGFGIFSVKERKPRIGRNPRTRKEVKIPGRTVVVFKPSKLIKEMF